MESPEAMRRRSAAANVEPELSAHERVVLELHRHMSRQLNESVGAAADRGETSASLELRWHRRVDMVGARRRPLNDPTSAAVEMEAAERLRLEYETAGYSADITIRRDSYTHTEIGNLASAYGGNEHVYETECRYLEVDWSQARQ